MNSNQSKLADEKQSVAAIYEDAAIAGKYLDKRLTFSWQRLLHERQVGILNKAVQRYRPKVTLEVAPGPARLSAELRGINRGVMIENSEEMLNIARKRLKEVGLAGNWDVRSGDAFKLNEAVPAEHFDFAYTFRFLRHFRTRERELLYAQLRGTLKQGGWLMFDVVNGPTLQWVESKNPQRARGEIPIYDVSYTQSSFEEEMRKNGFNVESLIPLVRHFKVQSSLSYKLDDVFRPLVRTAVYALEMVPSSNPLEWVALCRKV